MVECEILSVACQRRLTLLFSRTDPDLHWDSAVRPGSWFLRSLSDEKPGPHCAHITTHTSFFVPRLVYGSKTQISTQSPTKLLPFRSNALVILLILGGRRRVKSDECCRKNIPEELCRDHGPIGP